MEKGKKGVVSFVFIFILTIALALSFIPIENIDSCQDPLDCQSDYIPIYNRICIITYSILDISSTDEDASDSEIISEDDISKILDVISDEDASDSESISEEDISKILDIISDEDANKILDIISKEKVSSTLDVTSNKNLILGILKIGELELEQQYGGIYCGDGNCGVDLGENYRNCPSDCCAPEGVSVMPGQECCYGLINVEEIIPWQVSPTILRYCILCGDGICKEHENYLNCPEDCAGCENLILGVEIIMGFDERLQPSLPISPAPIIQPVINPIQELFGL
jgi:hypothetical protein